MTGIGLTIPCYGQCGKKYSSIEVVNGWVMTLTSESKGRVPICGECMQGLIILRRAKEEREKNSQTEKIQP